MTTGVFIGYPASPARLFRYISQVVETRELAKAVVNEERQ